MNKLSRRSMLAASAAFCGATALPCAAAHAPKKWDVTCDVLVVGGGAAGMSAAVSAKEAGGGKVLLIEKTPSLFLNSTTYSMGQFSACNSKVMQKNGIKDPGAADFAAEIMKGGHGKNDARLVKLYAENSGATIDWLSAMGQTFRMVPNPAYGVLRTHDLGNPQTGGRHIEVLLKQAEKIGVEIWTDCPAKELIVNEDASKVLGVMAEREDKKIAIKATKGVILCTGGFMSNGSLVDNYLINFRGAISCAGPSATGDGLLMAQKIGAQTCFMNNGAVYCYGVPVDPKSRRGLIFRGHIMNIYGSISVGPDAKRFVRDELGATTAGIAASARGYDKTFVLATEEQINNFMSKDATQVIGWTQEKFKKELEENKIFARKANTIEELAKKLELDPKALRKTIDTYNGYVKAGKDPEFGRTALKGTFEKGPFYGFVCKYVAMANLGGLKAGETLEILDVYDKPIRHLYAAGETLGGVHGDSYLSGNSIGACLTLGRVIGQKVAQNKA